MYCRWEYPSLLIEQHWGSLSLFMFVFLEVIFLSYIIYILNNWLVWHQFVLLLWEILSWTQLFGEGGTMSNFWKKNTTIYHTPTKLKLLQKSQSTSFIVTSLISHICKEMYPLLSLFISYFFVYLWVFLLLLILFLSFLHSKGDPFLIVGTKPLFILFYFFFSIPS